MTDENDQVEDPDATPDEEIDKLLRETVKSLLAVKPDATLNNVAAIFFHIAFEAAENGRLVSMAKIVVMGGEMLESGAKEILAMMTAARKGKRPKWRS